MKIQSQSVEIASQNNLNRQIGEAYADALEKMAVWVRLKLSQGEKLVYPHSIKVEVDIQNMDMVVKMTEVMILDAIRLDGLYRKYIVSKASGEPVDPSAQYLVLRIDSDMAAREAAICYARAISGTSPQLSEDIFAWVDINTPKEDVGVELDGGINAAQGPDSKGSLPS